MLAFWEMDENMLLTDVGGGILIVCCWEGYFVLSPDFYEQKLVVVKEK